MLLFFESILNLRGLQSLFIACKKFDILRPLNIAAVEKNMHPVDNVIHLSFNRPKVFKKLS